MTKPDVILKHTCITDDGGTALRKCKACEAERSLLPPSIGIKFGLDAEQYAQALKWMRAHEHPSGAIGGVHTFEFTPTGIGVVERVRCACGEHLDLTDYGSW